MKLTPDVDSVPPDENGRRVGVLLHGLAHRVGEVLLARRVLDDGHLERVEVRERLADAAEADALDHLLVRDAEALCVLAEEEREHDCGVSLIHAST